MIPLLLAGPALAATLTATAPNVVFLEGFGSGLLYSVNYERLAFSSHVGLRVGASYFTYPVSSYGKSGNLSLLSVPLVVSGYLGGERHKAQLGVGATVLSLGAPTDSEGTAFGGERAGTGVAATGVVGYRYLPDSGGFTFGVAFTPLLRGSKFLPWGGVNAGYAF